MDLPRSELDAVLASMGVKDALAVGRYGGGHINDTFRVCAASGAEYILQRVNTGIFTDVAALADNVRTVTGHLKAKGARTIDVVAFEGPWRLYRFISGCTSYDVVQTPAEAFAVALAFAKFQDELSDLDVSRLHEILPGFHDTALRLRHLDEAARADVMGRRAEVAADLAFVDARRGMATTISSMTASGAIPLRAVHNDAKANNVLVPKSGDGDGVVIDLDSTMPGSALCDFGDMVRSSSATAAEDEADLSKVGADRNLFEALVAGYLEGARFLTREECALMTLAGRISTLEVGMRVLTDYLAGDTYFKTAYPGHNLVRARNQFRMVESLEAQERDFAAIAGCPAQPVG